jgi:hypothetical protein
MAVAINSFFEERLDRLFQLTNILEEAFSTARIDYPTLAG